MDTHLQPGVLGNIIREGRIARHLSQEQLAELLGISSTHVKHIESEHRKPSIDLLYRIFKILNLSFDAIIYPGVESSITRGKIDRLLDRSNDKQQRIILVTLEAMLDDYN